MDWTTIAVNGSISVGTLIAVVYYIKGKLDRIEKDFDNARQEERQEREKQYDRIIKYIDTRFNDLREYVDSKFEYIYRLFNTRVKNIEEIIYREE